MNGIFNYQFTINYNYLPCLLVRLLCFYAVGWVTGKASILYKLSGEVLAWLSVCSEVQMICIWSSWCHSTPSSLASLKSRFTFLGSAYPDCPEKEAIKWKL